MDCIALVRSGNPYDLMFFSELSDPRWLPLLRGAGAFENLPTTVVRGDTTYYARAVPLIGLAKLAPIASADVVDILASLSIPNNPQVHDQIMRVIRAVDDLSLAPRLVPILQRLFESRSTSEWLWLDDILLKWLNGNAHQASFDALTAFLQTIASDTREHGAHQTWQLAGLDGKLISRLAESEPSKIAELLFKVLRTWANAERTKLARSREQQSPDPDSDYPWSYWLEQFGAASVGSHDFESTLAQRLYKIGRTIYGKSEHSAIDRLDELLRSDRWHLFRRMRWQWYAEFPSLTLRFARPDVLERIPRLNLVSARHGFEFAALLETHATQHGDAFLVPDEVRQFADVVFSGPIDDNGNVDTEYRDRFHRLQLHPIRTLLVGEALRRYNELSTPDEVPRDVYKPFSLGGGEARVIEHASPADEKQLAELSDGDLWNFLNTWQPTRRPLSSDRWWIEEHASALGNEFIKLLEAHPTRFRLETEWWRNIHRPAVLSKLIERATGKLEQNAETKIDEITPEWQTWFGVASWITEQATAEVDGRETAENWNWPKIVVIKFLRAAIRCKGAASETMRVQIGTLLRRLVSASDVQLATVKTPGMDDWLTIAINSSRGTAIEALLDLALAQKRDSDRHVPEPWIFELIAKTLRSRDESPAVFAILGAHLRLAAYLFADSLRTEPQLLMPDDRPAHRASFLVSHFLYDNPTSQVIDVLPTLLDVALSTIRQISEGSSGHRRGNFASRVGTHLCFYYWNDLLGDMSAANKLIDQFLEEAAPASRAETVGQIARIFADAEPPENQSLYERVMQLWDHWFRRIRELVQSKSQARTNFTAELGEFIEWLDCNCFAFEWRFKRAIEAIAYMETPPRAYRLIDTLSDFAAHDKLDEAVMILHAIAAKSSDEIQWAYREERLKPLLKHAFASRKRVIVLLAESIQERLLSAGLFEYLDLSPEEKVEERVSV